MEISFEMNKMYYKPFPFKYFAWEQAGWWVQYQHPGHIDSILLMWIVKCDFNMEGHLLM